MEENMTNTAVEGKKRPTFLTVLIILTFIGVAWAVIGNLISLFTASAAQALAGGAMEASGMEGMENIPGMKEAIALLKYGKILAIIGIVAALICLAGALMMWKLKKSGFFIYLIGEWAPVVATIILIGFSFTGGIMAILGMIFPLIMTILYGVNLKHMS